MEENNGIKLITELFCEIVEARNAKVTKMSSEIVDVEFPMVSWYTEKPSSPTDFPFNKDCNDISYEYDLATCIVCGVCFVFGIIFVFFGYRCFKAVMFLVGFILATSIVFLICEEESNLGRTINACIALGIGILCGLLTMMVEVVGLFMTGVHMGLFTATAVLIVMEQFYAPDLLVIPILITFGLCIIFALLTLKFQKEFVVLATSLIGGAIVTSCADYFLEVFRMVQYIYDRFRLQKSADLCWYSWVVFGLWPFISLIGILVQFTLTSRGYNHKDAAKTKKGRRVELQKIRQKQKHKESKEIMEEPGQKYCDLIRARSRHADIVTQSYLQSIQNHLSPEMQRIASLQHIPSEPNLQITQAPPDLEGDSMPPQTTVSLTTEVKIAGMTEV